MTQTATPDAPVQALPQYQITQADKQRQKRIARAWAAYEGNLVPPLQKTKEGIDPNVMSNRCAPIADEGRDFLFGKELEISVEEAAPQGAQDFLNAVWGRKEARIPLLQKLDMNGAMAGQAFLRIVPGSAKPGKAQTFRLVLIDPSTVFVQTVPGDCETVLLYCIEYCTEEQINGKPEKVFYREEICRIDPDGNAQKGMPDDDDTWQIQHWTRIGQKGQWKAAGEPIAWPYPFPPIFSNQNLPKPNDFWGYPDITDDIIGMNESLNITNSSINLIQLKYGMGLLYATNAGEGVIENEPGKIICLPLPDSQIAAVAIPNDTPNALAFAADIRSDIDEQSHVPGVATGRIKDMPRGNLSGIAIELLFQPLMSKTEVKRCLYGKTIIDVSKALLVLGGYCKRTGDLDVGLEWASPLPADALQDIQAAIALGELGVSKTTRLRKLGEDPEEEVQLLQSETEQALNAALNTSSTPPQLPQGYPGAPNLPGQLYPPATPASGQNGNTAGATGGQS